MALKQTNIILIFGLVLILVMGAAVYAVDDGRINEAAHVGGYVIYCIDQNGLVTNDYDSATEIRILDANGDIHIRTYRDNFGPLVEQAKNGGIANTSLGSATTSPYPSIELWVVSGGKFKVTGLDEHGSIFEFEWLGCESIGPAEGSRDNVTEVVPVSEPPCIECEPPCIECEQPFIPPPPLPPPPCIEC